MRLRRSLSIALASGLLVVSPAAAPAEEGAEGEGEDTTQTTTTSGGLLPPLAPITETVGGATETLTDTIGGTVTTVTTASDGTTTTTTTVSADPAAPPTVTVTAPPQTGESLGVVPSGAITVTLPGAGGTVDAKGGAIVPVGSIIDARRGEIALVSAQDARGAVQTGVFSGGKFEVRQTSGPNPITELLLRGGDFRRCGRRGEQADRAVQESATRLARRLTPTARAAGSPVVRKLWGRDRSGRFRTRGRHAAATVRGTRWVTEDRCEGTRVAVTEGAVSVWPTAGGRSKLVRAGESLLTRP